MKRKMSDTTLDLENNSSKHQCLHTAITSCDISTVKTIIENGESLCENCFKLSENTEITSYLLQMNPKLGLESINESIFLQDEFILHQLVQLGLVLNNEMLLNAAKYNSCVTIFILLLHYGLNILYIDENGKNVLHYTNNQNIDVIQFLISNGADINCIDKHGNTPLHCVFSSNNNDIVSIGIVQLLLKSNVNVQNEQGLTPIMLALKSRDLEIIQLLIQNGTDCTIQDLDGLNVLGHALLLNSSTSQIVKCLLEAGTNTSIQNINGKTPLMLSCEHSDPLQIVEIIQLLIQFQSNVTLKDNKGHTALYYLCTRDIDTDIKLEILKLLITIDSFEIEMNDEMFSKILLNCSVEKTSSAFEIIKIIFNKNLPTISNLIEIMKQLSHCDNVSLAKSVLKLLINNGLDVNMKINNNCTFLILISMFTSDATTGYELCKLLLENGGNISNQDAFGNTALFHAVHRPSQIAHELTKLFLSHNANPSVSNNAGISPFLTACLNENYEICKMLLESGVDVNTKFENGDNALNVVTHNISSNTLDLVKLLLQYNVNTSNVNKLKCTPLINICKSIPLDDFENYKQIIHDEFFSLHSDINQKDHLGNTALFYATLNGNYELTKILLQKGANPNVVNNMNQTPFLNACNLTPNPYKYQIVRELIVNNCNVNVKDKYNNTGLNLILKYKNVDIELPNLLKLLINSGVDLYVKNCKNNVTPLMKICQISDPVIAYKCAETLIKAGVDVNEINEHGLTALMFAVASMNGSNKLELIKLLLKNKANPLIMFQNPHLKNNFSNHMSAIAIAVNLKDKLIAIDVLKLLLNSLKSTVVKLNEPVALFRALTRCYNDEFGSIELVKMLLDFGIHDNLIIENTTPLIYLITKYFIIDPSRTVELIKMFLINGSDPNQFDANQRLPLLCAIHLQDVHGLEIVKCLLKHGSNPNLKSDRYDYTALYIAIRNNALAYELIDVLTQYNVNLNMLSFRRTPLHFALLIKSDLRVLQLLIEKSDSNNLHNQMFLACFHLGMKCSYDQIAKTEMINCLLFACLSPLQIFNRTGDTFLQFLTKVLLFNGEKLFLLQALRHLGGKIVNYRNNFGETAFDHAIVTYFKYVENSEISKSELDYAIQCTKFVIEWAKNENKNYKFDDNFYIQEHPQFVLQAYIHVDDLSNEFTSKHVIADLLFQSNFKNIYYTTVYSLELKSSFENLFLFSKYRFDTISYFLHTILMDKMNVKIEIVLKCIDRLLNWGYELYTDPYNISPLTVLCALFNCKSDSETDEICVVEEDDVKTLKDLVELFVDNGVDTNHKILQFQDLGLQALSYELNLPDALWVAALSSNFDSMKYLFRFWPCHPLSLLLFVSPDSREEEGIYKDLYSLLVRLFDVLKEAGPLPPGSDLLLRLQTHMHDFIITEPQLVCNFIKLHSHVPTLQELCRAQIRSQCQSGNDMPDELSALIRVPALRNYVIDPFSSAPMNSIKWSQLIFINYSKVKLETAKILNL